MSERFEDLVRGLDPDVGTWVLVPGGDPRSNVAFERNDTAVRAAANLLRREFGEEALDEVQPRRARWREVQVEARMSDEPILDRRGLVGRVVVEHEVHGERARHLVVNALEGILELDRPVE